MTKKHFIALADIIRQHPTTYNQNAIAYLADFCESQNPAFNRSRWLGYIAGTNGKNGGRVKA